MERLTISKFEKQTIYEIYRSCRLCGAGGGYRMPIIQNIVVLDDSNVELRQKIQDCLQLEVRSDDRMPPLICELCVDKVNDFYKFMQLAQQTNIRTRTKLGLPLQTVRREDKVESDNKDSIPRDTEVKQEKPVPKKGKAGPKCSKKKEEEPVNVDEEVTVPSPRESRSSSLNRPSKSSKPATPPSRGQPKSTPKVTQQSNTAASQPSRSQSSKTTKVTQVTHEKNSGKEKNGQEKQDGKESEIKKQTRYISRKELQNLLEDNASFEDNSLLVPRAQKRLREHDIPKPLIIPKRPKPTPKEPIKVEPPKEPTPPRPKPRPKSKQDPKNIPTPLKIPKKAKPDETPPLPKVEPPKTYNCVVCNMPLKTVQAVTNHTRHHVPNYTKPQNACNPCAKWFPTTEEANTHHRYHRATTFPYHCRRCFDDYRTLPEYDLHITNNKCVPWETVPDVKCEECWKTFPTDNLRKAHKCPGIDARPGGKCSNCSRTYATSKSLKKHESTCNQKRKRDLIADPDVLRRLKPMQVRISRCDDLVADPGEYVDVSTVKPNYCLDRQYLYPYMKYKVKIKSTNKGKPKCKRDNYTHWDSETSDDDSTKVHKLSTLCIKKLFSENLIGKVPRKRRKVKNEESNGFDNINNDMNNILSSLEDDTESIANSARNELLIASLNDIIGVPQEGNETVDSNESYVTNDCNTALDEKSEITNQVTEIDPTNSTRNDDVMNENDGDTALTNDSVLNENKTHSDTECVSKNTGTEDVDMDENDVNNAEFEEKSEIFDGNETQGNAEDTGNDNVLSNVNDVNFNDCNSAQEEKCEISKQNDVEENSKCTESSNVDSYEDDKAVFSENNEVLNQNDQYVADDTGTENVEGNDVNTNESALNDDETGNEVSNENSDDTSNVRVMGNEPVVSEENDNISTNNSEEEIESMHDEPVSSEVFSAIKSDVSTKPHLEDSEHNDIENDCDNEESNQEELINNSENATENRIESEFVNNIGNDEESNKDEDSVDLETNTAPLVDNENNTTVNGINNHENETEQNDSETNENSETETKNMDVNNVSTKESPIKHSIENIIGDTDKNPQRYIEEVISSLENIIMKNPRTEEPAEKVNGDIKDDIEDQNLLDALDAQIGEERKSDNDQITLDDLLTKEDRSMELDDISDDDFDFDA